jgi:hypothetical protein
MGASVRGKPPNALRAKGVVKEEEEESDEDGNETLGFHIRRRRFSRPAEGLSASQGLCSMELSHFYSKFITDNHMFP